MAAELRQRIKRGTLPPDQPLPSLPQLQQEFGASLNVVRYAVKQLVTERLVATRHGKGNYVTNPDEWLPNEAADIMRQLLALQDEIRGLRKQADDTDRRLDGIDRRLDQFGA